MLVNEYRQRERERETKRIDKATEAGRGTMFGSSFVMQCARYSTIGFVGLGNMGRPMALNLARRNPVLGYDSDPRAHRQLQGDIGELCVVHSRKAVQEADIIFTMLPSRAVCLDVYCGDEGLARLVSEREFLL